MQHRNLDRCRDEAEIVSRFVQLQRALLVAAWSESDYRSQRYALEDAAAIGTEQENTTRVVFIRDDVDFRARAQRQITQQVARRERGDEEIFGVIDVGVAAKHRIGAAG